MANRPRELARAKNFDLMIEDHGLLALDGMFYYDSGSCQGLGRVNLSGEFLKRFMGVFGVHHLRDVNNKVCWVTGGEWGIAKLEPLMKDSGEAFDMDKFSEDEAKKAKK